MPHKAKAKPVSNATLTLRPSATTEQFLTAMDQNHCLASQFTMMELMTITQADWELVLKDLHSMNFINEPISDPNMPIIVNKDDNYTNEEISPAGELTNAIAAFRQWFEGNNIQDDKCPGLVDNIRHITMVFNLIPAPHHCPAPTPCMHPHQDAAIPCQCLHADNVPLPPPCICPHHNGEDILMEPSAPTHAFSEAASQTPAPSHEATTPPPPPVTVATLPAAVTSSPPAGPCGCASYAGTVAKNLNPAAPPFCAWPPTCTTCSTLCPGPTACLEQAPTIPKGTSLPTLVKTANTALVCTKSTLQVDSACFTPCGIMCATALVPSTSDLDIIEATLSDIPFFKPSTTKPLPNAEVGTQLQCSIIPSDYVMHWCFICNDAPAPLNLLANTFSLMEQRSLSRGQKPTLERLSASIAGIGVTVLKCVAAQQYAAPSVLALI
ncbi:hypothetical protein P691DRAFT_767251 [Macrolepiota fuliginosa MF-IS2]|uniref:Uncharacterized protein n=1 Tax=Macrolepiota fuliginosa MF-IS2 TaxID=1400762 RepID=A0A9P6BWU3_9AGAR|nr:hypothetical protein P691DRAFT_767251 [Macrolepiota fuliginosa MF-IS2]